jgi:hypothetical protein
VPVQSADVVQVVLQAVVPQMNGSQLLVAPGGQLPAPSQDAAAFATPAVQVADAQGFSEPGK